MALKKSKDERVQKIVPGIVGFAKAVEISQKSMGERREKYLAIRERMLHIWEEEGIEFSLNGHPLNFSLTFLM